MFNANMHDMLREAIMINLDVPKLEYVKNITTGTTAADVEIGCNQVILKNAGAKTIYFKEKNDVACTTSNGFPLKSGEETILFVAETLSVVAESDAPILSVAIFR